ncbi:MAG: DNA recombination protein RmuC [Candidatus Portnoybacteria bacterium CG10_big_fil_rev_8_21_14_0_10_38_18]|uniref:DNA recombination protein RmuC n=1 Tax=Candidatus Portnoybacteria bacterium CG10_big_fil_rev_8_21_14_0_10_38_18 TaxID=1974813 RepID=A0A2M8KCX4_9BACT|nr:MAG: DNA recombination protein RmuC [Candidatus Portnoybacteria bacterium CG10_big_fil_rev_8_21_14_0_10_38_18]
MTYFLYIIIFILLGIVLYLVFGKKEKGLADELKEIRKELVESREKNMESLQKQLEESGKIARDATIHIKDITAQLERVHADSQHVKDVKEQLGKLTDVLANPKQRGILGEYFLETLLKNVFQPNQYKLQYKFKNGEVVDAVIFIKDKIIPIDSKFSLENYNRIVNEKDPGRREELEKLLKQDLKNRIEETAKYIRPSEGTMDFAFMFIPSEGIYYDLLINQVGAVKISTYDLIEYAFKEKHVIIVSPTSFYAYLQTVLQGLRALQIEEKTKDILAGVEKLRKHLLNYNDFLAKLGTHLGTTVSTYNRAYKEFSKIEKDTARLTEGKEKVEPVEIEGPRNIEEE